VTNVSGQNVYLILESGGSTNTFFTCVAPATEITKFENIFERNGFKNFWD